MIQQSYLKPTIQKDTCASNLHSSTVYNSQDGLKFTRWLDHDGGVYIQWNATQPRRNEATLVCSDVDGPEMITMKEARQRQRSYDAAICEI